MTSLLKPRTRADRPAIEGATKSVIEALEGRVLLSGGGNAAWTRMDHLQHLTSAPVQRSHAEAPTIGYPRKSPTDIMPAGIIRGSSATRFGYSVTQIRHLYGWDQ